MRETGGNRACGPENLLPLRSLTSADARTVAFYVRITCVVHLYPMINTLKKRARFARDDAARAAYMLIAGTREETEVIINPDNL